MKEINNNGEFTQGDVKRFLFNSHFAIISSIVVLGYATYINGPGWVSVLFGCYGLYRLWILNIYQSTKRKAWENDMDIVEYMNKNRREREY